MRAAECEVVGEAASGVLTYVGRGLELRRLISERGEEVRGKILQKVRSAFSSEISRHPLQQWGGYGSTAPFKAGGISVQKGGDCGISGTLSGRQNGSRKVEMASRPHV